MVMEYRMLIFEILASMILITSVLQKSVSLSELINN